MTQHPPHQQAVHAATQAGEANSLCAQADSAHPCYHFAAPSGWLNDPNGTIYHQGWYHLFYQYDPYTDDGRVKYWGHARSHDLLHWEHLPIALAPAADGIENGIWSGCVAINEAGTPIAFYTAANLPSAAEVPLITQQNAAIGSQDLMTWEKYPANPILQRDPAYREEWRDPFFFQAEGRSFLVVGMCGPGTPLFEAVDGSLLRWEYRGLLCEIDAECPNFFQVEDGKWLFLSSPFNNVRCAVGEFDADAGCFTIEQEGRYDWSESTHSDDYATNHLYAPDRRSILFGWIRGWEPGRGWNGCMALPREVHIDAAGILRTPPVKELMQLRGEGITLPAQELSDGNQPMAFDAGLQYEMQCRLSLGEARKAGFGLRQSAAGVTHSALWLEADGLHLDGVHIPLSAEQIAHPVDLQLFVDHSVAEIYVNGGQYCAVRIFKDFTAEDTGLLLFSSGGTAHFENLQVWRIDPS